MWANEAKEVIKTDLLERRAKKEGGGAVNSLLCRLLSRMNEAECLGRNQGQLARCSLGYSEDIYCLSPTLTASSFLDIFCAPPGPPTPFASLHVSSFPRQKTALASGLSRLLPPAQRIYRLPPSRLARSNTRE